MKVWVFADIGGGQPHPTALELLTKARSLGGEVAAIALGADAEATLSVLGEYGASTVFLGTDSAYSELLIGGPAADAVAILATEHEPDLILVGSSYNGRDMAGRLAAKLGSPVVANATDVALQGEKAVVTSAVFGGTQVVSTEVTHKPAIVLVRPKSFNAEPAGAASPQVIKIESPVAEVHRAAKVVKHVADAAAGPKLEDAKIVISGGRGLGDAKNFALLDQLAEIVHGAVGASRAVVDAGWVPYAKQVGQTGKTVKPTVYLACGISGAMQHTVGMKGSKHIVAINRDPDAPIFKLADLGVVGDALKILPQVIDELQSRNN